MLTKILSALLAIFFINSCPRKPKSMLNQFNDNKVSYNIFAKAVIGAKNSINSKHRKGELKENCGVKNKNDICLFEKLNDSLDLGIKDFSYRRHIYYAADNDKDTIGCNFVFLGVEDNYYFKFIECGHAIKENHFFSGNGNIECWVIDAQWYLYREHDFI